MMLELALARLRQKSRPRAEEAPMTMTTLPSRRCHGWRWLETLLAIGLVLEREIMSFPVLNDVRVSGIYYVIVKTEKDGFKI